MECRRLNNQVVELQNNVLELEQHIYELGDMVKEAHRSVQRAKLGSGSGFVDFKTNQQNLLMTQNVAPQQRRTFSSDYKPRGYNAHRPF